MVKIYKDEPKDHKAVIFNKVKDVTLNISIVGKIVGVSAPWVEDDSKQNKNKAEHIHYVIGVEQLNSRNKKIGVKVMFDYFTHREHPLTYSVSKDKRKDTQHDMYFALQCFLSDAWSGLSTFKEFCYEYGYDEDSRRCEGIHNECKRSLTKARLLFENDKQIEDTLEKLYELEL